MCSFFGLFGSFGMFWNTYDRVHGICKVVHPCRELLERMGVTHDCHSLSVPEPDRRAASCARPQGHGRGMPSSQAAAPHPSLPSLLFRSLPFTRHAMPWAAGSRQLWAWIAVPRTAYRAPGPLDSHHDQGARGGGSQSC